jgi:thiol-disulfide isomerase/thioredoxin
VAASRRRSLLIGSVIGLVVGAVAAILIVTIGGGGSASTPEARLTNPGAVPEPGSIGTSKDLSGRSLPGNTYARLGGGSTTLASYAGTPLIINLWSTTCEPCKTEMPAIQQVHQALGDKVHIVGLDRADVQSKAVSFAKNIGVTYDILFDPDDTFAPAMNIAIFPTTVLVGADGRVVTTHAGAMTAAELTALIQQAFPS